MPQRKSLTRIAVNTGGGDAPGLNAAIRAVVERRFGSMISCEPPSMVCRPMEDDIREAKRVAPDGEALRCAREIDICLGD